MLLQKILARIHELQGNLHTSQKNQDSKETLLHRIKDRNIPMPDTQHKCAYQLESLLFEPLDDLRHQSALNAVGLDHDESSFAGHFLHSISTSLSFDQIERMHKSG